MVPEVLRGILLAEVLAPAVKWCSGALMERGVSDGQPSPTERRNGCSMASTRVRPSFEGLAVVATEATGRGGSGFSTDTERPLSVTSADESLGEGLLASLSAARWVTRAAHLVSPVNAVGADVSRRGSLEVDADSRAADGTGLRWVELDGVVLAAETCVGARIRLAGVVAPRESW